MEIKLILPKILQNGCVLQRGIQTRIWGQYTGEAQIEVCFQNQTYMIEKKENNDFELYIDCQETGGPFMLEIYAGNLYENREVYVGDVFVCAGQSNMELPIARVRERFPDIVGNTQVHEYKVEECICFKEKKDHVDAKWRSCNEAILDEVSALAFFYGDYIQKKENIPIGIINISKGGTPVEAWTQKEELEAYPDFIHTYKTFSDDTYRENFYLKQTEEEKEWHRYLEEQEKSASICRKWNTCYLPGDIEEASIEGLGAILYVTKTIFLTKEEVKRDAILRLGTLVDADKTYINDIYVGSTEYRFPPRIYPVKADVLKEGENQIRIRLEVRAGGARVTKDKRFDLTLLDGKKIELSGEWQYQVIAKSTPAPLLYFPNRIPGVLFSGMVAPSLGICVKAVLWYQGESNDRDADRYEALLRNMILNWRSRWKQDRLPFIIIGLPICEIDNHGPKWFKIREAQLKMRELEDVAVTINLDLGEYNDLHPLNKKDVAYRAYMATRHLIYGEHLVWEGPKLLHVCTHGNVLILEFDTKDGKDLCLEAWRGIKDLYFEVLYDMDKTPYYVQAKIEGDSVHIISDREVNTVCRIRYAYAHPMVGALIKNQSNFLVAPFICERKGGRLCIVDV